MDKNKPSRYINLDGHPNNKYSCIQAMLLNQVYQESKRGPESKWKQVSIIIDSGASDSDTPASLFGTSV